MEPDPLPPTRYTATLQQKLLLSEPAQCWHLEFTVDGVDNFAFEPGQFISCVALDANGKSQVRAYSLASAPQGNRFGLCVNRVEGGFFSNLLCDLSVGEQLGFNGPLGTFTLQRPLKHSLLIATGTGVAPFRGFVQALFPAAGACSGQSVHLIYGTRHETELHYADYFAEVARLHPNFTYTTVLSRAAEAWAGPRGYVQDEAARLLADAPPDALHSRPRTEHAYLCGFRDMIKATRERLVSLGWEKKQIDYERFD